MTECLYRHFSSAGELLYVGVTHCPISRLGGHKSLASWYHEIATITIERFPNRFAALNAEEIAIRNEVPRENCQHNRAKKKIKPLIKGHYQMDLLQQEYDFYYSVSHSYLKCSIQEMNDIRESGRSLTDSEFLTLRTTLRTTFKRMAKIGLPVEHLMSNFKKEKSK